jgi:DNA-binding transcriptional LysR family regulator
MDRLEALHAFALAVEHGSLAAAARILRKSPASITRAIDALEARVGTALLRRTTRAIALTEAGERYLAVARRVLAELDDVERITQSVTTAPRGLLTVTAPVAFGNLHVVPIVDDFVDAHPQIRAKLLLLDRLLRIDEEGVDVAIRIGRLPDSSLIATSVGSVRRIVVASPKYLARHGRPEAPADLARHRCVASTALITNDVWTFARGARVRIEPVVTVNVAEGAIRSAVDGTGITCALSYQVAGHLDSGALVRILAPHEPSPVPVHVVHPKASGRTAKVRAFVAMAVPRLRAVLS